jgi:hypothetical protein
MFGRRASGLLGHNTVIDASLEQSVARKMAEKTGKLNKKEVAYAQLTGYFGLQIGYSQR